MIKIQRDGHYADLYGDDGKSYSEEKASKLVKEGKAYLFHCNIVKEGEDE